MRSENYPYFGKFDENLSGTDYVVGDIHGRYDELMMTLEKIKFDFKKDRLFATGDLGDRGPDSIKTIALVNEPWFFSVRGNHDQFVIDCFEEERVMLYGGYAEVEPQQNYRQVTKFESDWYFALSEEKRKEMAETLKRLPYMIELKFNGKSFGITHAGMPEGFDDWHKVTDNLENRDLRERLLRQRRHAVNTSHGKDRVLSGIDYTIHGHSCFPQPVFGQYSAFIDTYDKSNKLSVLSLEKLLEKRLDAKPLGEAETKTLYRRLRNGQHSIVLNSSTSKRISSVLRAIDRVKDQMGIVVIHLDLKGMSAFCEAAMSLTNSYDLDDASFAPFKSESIDGGTYFIALLQSILDQELINEKRVLLFIEEFQLLSKFEDMKVSDGDIDETGNPLMPGRVFLRRFRTLLQNQENVILFVSGSDETSLLNLFGLYEEPLFRAALPINI